MNIRSIVLVACALAPLSTLADQSDERLNGLFSTLAQTDDPRIIQNTEIRIWEVWLQHDDTNVSRLMSIATERMNYQRYAEAMLVFTQIIESFPDYAEAWNKRATLNYLLGNMEESIADIERTLELEPRHFGALSGLGLVYIQRKQFTKAKQAFEDLIRVHPNSANAKQNLELVNEQLRFGVI